jgi:RNA polymerase sigma factor (TIGR02999 family)
MAVMGDDITELLQRARAGDRPALDELLPLIYAELHRLAHAQHARGPATLLNTTALVHEAYLKLVSQPELSWPDRRHFYAYAARAMRSILVDNARRRGSDKRGGGAVRDDDALERLQAGDESDLLAVDQALRRLAQISDRLREVVELHVFAGLEFSDIAACLELTERTIFRDWRKARALLQSMLVQT